MTTILSILGLILYLVNFYIGWIGDTGKRPITRSSHRIIYTLLILDLTFVVLFTDLESMGFSFAGFSLMMVLILPLIKKGSIYHKIVSTLGLILYLLFLIS